MKKTKIILALIILLSVNSAFALTAVWTGRQTQVQTITYRFMWNCEYTFGGQKFWVIFDGSCPSSVDVK